MQCHFAEVSAWQKSHHAKAMATATSENVLADFGDVKVPFGTHTARFFKDQENYIIEFDEGDGMQSYKVKYTFGFYPLQQYLVPAEGGKYQVFPLAWDSRPKAEGGQRWYPVLSPEEIEAEPRLHWQQPLQNWNGMCADCHSDGLERNYNIEKKQFSTRWDNINVGCLSCHGDMSEHPYKPPTKPHKGPSQTNEMVSWVLGDNEKIATLRTKDGKPASKEIKDARQEFMDTCYACHSLRAPLTDGFTHDKSFLDQFIPTLISSPLYHADGQISEEVYVFGSFQQSKMYEAGVTCLDCHNAHTMQVKTNTNGLCLQCHSAEEYQQPAHIHHELDSEAGQCVACHMPATMYMGVDDRRDHSFKVPRPALSIAYDTPNVCVDCHTDKSNQWADQTVKKWFPDPIPLSVNEQNFVRLLHGQKLTQQEHTNIINDKELSDIHRASALALLPYSFQGLNDQTISQWVQSDIALIRLATAQIGFLLPPLERKKSYLQLLNDKFKAVRVEAAEHLIELDIEQSEVLKRAMQELVTSDEVSSWRGEGATNLSLTQLKQGKMQSAIATLQHSIEIDPYFAPAYINLLDMYRMTNATALEQETYSAALQKLPDYAPLQYAYGLYNIRNKEVTIAIDAFQKAVEIEPYNPQYVYLLVLAIDSNGDTARALELLKSKIVDVRNQQLVELGLSLSRKAQNQGDFDFFRRLY